MIRDIARWVALAGVFIIPFLPLIVTNSLFFPFITGKNFIFRIVVEIAFAAWVILAFYDAKYRPRFSYILVSFGALLGIMALADAFGVSPHKSFWSNYERMDGYVTLIHLGLYFVVAGTMLQTERLWHFFLNTSMLVALFMMLYGFCQLSGSASCPISQSDTRIDGRMGNAAYLAVYMLFHVFISAFLLVRARTYVLKGVYALLCIGFIFILTETATRGTLAALAGGSLLAALYVAVMERQNKRVRTIAIGAVLFVFLAVGSFYMAKDSSFVQSRESLRRLSTVFSLKELETRATIWKLALEGVKERPLLGWGQENFNYVFNSNYKASLYGQEPWFDRVHNIVLDWLIAGGILGLLAYLALFFSGIYYLAVRPFTHPSEVMFSVAERGVLFGLFGGYVLHNMLVFDNLISYFLFVSIIALIHSRVATEIPKLTRITVHSDILSNVVAPVTVVVLCVTLFMVNVPSLQAASDLIRAFQSPDPRARLEGFKTALARDGFANQEIREQLVRITQEFTQQGPALVQQVRQKNPTLTQQQAEAQVNELRTQYVTLAEAELAKQVVETKDDVRILVFQASFYRLIGKQKEAIAVLEKARALSPEKQQIYFELGLSYIESKDVPKGVETFKTAFDYEPNNVQARMFYAASALYLGTPEGMALYEDLVKEHKEASYSSDFLLRAAYTTRHFDIVKEILSYKSNLAPDDLQLRVSLAVATYQLNDTQEAIAILEKATADFPEFKAQGDQYIKALREGKVPKD